MDFHTRSRDEVELNITPLIDVVFLLLIFFMVSTTFEQNSEMNITLPKASKEVVKKRFDAVNIYIDGRSQIHINDEKLLNTQISTIKESIYNTSLELDDATVVISADRETPYQLVIKTMDAARQLGLVNITFATQIDDGDY